MAPSLLVALAWALLDISQAWGLEADGVVTLRPVTLRATFCVMLV